MGPPSYMRSVVDRNIVTRHINVRSKWTSSRQSVQYIVSGDGPHTLRQKFANMLQTKYWGADKSLVQPGLHGSNDHHDGQKMATFQLFFQSGRAKDLSAPLHKQLRACTWRSSLSYSLGVTRHGRTVSRICVFWTLNVSISWWWQWGRSVHGWASWTSVSLF